VVVAARDEEEHIRACLEGLLGQDYPAGRCEVIVVDDGSQDATPQIVREYLKKNPALSLLSAREAGGRTGSKKAALSLGIEAARGEIIMTTDAHCRVPGGWVRHMAACFDEGTGMVAGFSQIGAPGQIQGLRQGCEAVDFLCLMGCIWGSAGMGHPMAASGQNLAYRKRAFQEVGGYEKVMHRASGDDVLLLQMVRRLGRWRIGFATAPESFVVHPASSSWGGFFQQRSRWASNAPLQLLLDPLFFAYMAATFGLSVLLVAAPMLVALGGMNPLWASGCFAAKVLAEYAVFRKAMGLSGRRDLHGYFPFWAIAQPLHVVVTGISGCLGIFRWKGQRHRWGVRPRPARGQGKR
jgi:cellulose synthase/poly-beta-1,6-N-acetylglucosamine synthase-like glycosyltransferase